MFNVGCHLAVELGLTLRKEDCPRLSCDHSRVETSLDADMSRPFNAFRIATVRNSDEQLGFGAIYNSRQIHLFDLMTQLGS